MAQNPFEPSVDLRPARVAVDNQSRPSQQQCMFGRVLCISNPLKLRVEPFRYANGDSHGKNDTTLVPGELFIQVLSDNSKGNSLFRVA